MKWKPSKKATAEFAGKMDEIEVFCANNGISKSFSGDSYYFTVNGQKYRVSNHTVEKSNAGAFDELSHEPKRDLYHPNGREDDTVYITAGKTRIIDVFNDLKAGYVLDKRGYRKNP